MMCAYPNSSTSLFFTKYIFYILLSVICSWASFLITLSLIRYLACSIGIFKEDILKSSEDGTFFLASVCSIVHVTIESFDRRLFFPGSRMRCLFTSSLYAVVMWMFHQLLMQIYLQCEHLFCPYSFTLPRRWWYIFYLSFTSVYLCSIFFVCFVFQDFTLPPFMRHYENSTDHLTELSDSNISHSSNESFNNSSDNISPPLKKLQSQKIRFAFLIKKLTAI